MDRLIQQAKIGNEQAIEQIVSQYKGLVRSYANKFFLVGGDKDDLLQEGMLGLFRAITNYDENKGSFPSFVQMCVLRQILNAVRVDKGIKNKPLSDSIDIEELKDRVDACATPLETLIEKEYFARINDLIASILTSSERKIFTLFADGFSYEDIMAETGKSFKSIDGALQRARKKLQSRLDFE